MGAAGFKGEQITKWIRWTDGKGSGWVELAKPIKLDAIDGYRCAPPILRAIFSLSRATCSGPPLKECWNDREKGACDGYFRSHGCAHVLGHQGGRRPVRERACR